MSGLKEVAETAVLNANYLKACLGEAYHVPYPQTCMHEFILTSQNQHARHDGVNTMTLAKRLMDYGFHPPTVYFPLIVPEAMMLEPTETESKGTLDEFIAAMLRIDGETRENPEIIVSAPHTTPVGRVDEVQAARSPNLNFYKTGGPALQEPTLSGNPSACSI